MMNRIFKYALLFMGAVMMQASLVSCDNDDNGGKDDGEDIVITPENTTNPTNTDFSNNKYGKDAIDACEDVVTNLENAYRVIAQAKLTSDQEKYLKEAIANLVDNVIVPTYTSLADETEALESELHGLDVNTITQSDINKACESFRKARKYWELSEAFLGGAASDFDIDPTIDSWPLNRSLLHNYFTGGMTDDIADDATVLGFHALEFILFRDGQPRKVAEFKANDTYKNFQDIKGSDELQYAQEVCSLLKERTFQLQVAWEGEKDQNRAKVVKAAGLGITTENGLSYGDNMKQAGEAKSTFPKLTDALAQILSADEGSAAAIATEVGTAKIANPFSAGDISYVESPYSYNSIEDFQDNIRSIRNIWYGTTTGKANSKVKSMYGFFNEVNKKLNAKVVNSYNVAINAIGAMPAPFVKYCSTLWNIAFEDDNDWDLEE